MDEMKRDEDNRAVKTNGGRKQIAIVTFIVIAVIGVIAVSVYLQYKSTHITTDDAFIEGNIHTVASRVPGTVKTVIVESNQHVKAGDVLVEIDPVDYEVRVLEAQASLNAEKAKLIEIDARIDAAKRQLDDAKAKFDAIRASKELQEANLDQAEKDRVRAENIYKKDAISKERYEKALTAHKVAIAQVRAASENLKSFAATVDAQKAVIRQTEAAKVVQFSSISQKEAMLETAKLNAGYTKLVSPADGYVTKKSVEAGNQVQPGQPLMAVVRLDDIHIIANYKETQLKKIRPGQKVEIKVDTYSGKTFKGTVDSIMAGTGAAFSLFPPENATGNFVKVVQRIPVKIVLDKDTDKEHALRIGMSVEPTVILEK